MPAMQRNAVPRPVAPPAVPEHIHTHTPHERSPIMFCLAWLTTNVVRCHFLQADGPDHHARTLRGCRRKCRGNSNTRWTAPTCLRRISWVDSVGAHASLWRKNFLASATAALYALSCLARSRSSLIAQLGTNSLTFPPNIVDTMSSTLSYLREGLIIATIDGSS